jgi:hypothetical protein
VELLGAVPGGPPRKRKAVPLTGPAIVRKGTAKLETANDDRKPAIVIARRPGARSSVDVPDMTLEEHQRRGEAADALFREIVRRATE